MSHDTFDYIYITQYPDECCPFEKEFLHLKCLSGIPVWPYILWKCFSQVLNRKCGSFLYREDDTEQHSLRVDSWGWVQSVPWYPISTTVWGIVSFISYWVFPQPSVGWTKVNSTLCLCNTILVFFETHVKVYSHN